MNTKNALLISILFLISCKTNIVKSKEVECQIIKTTNKIGYINDTKGLEKEINNYKGLIRDELNRFYKSNYKYDFLLYTFLNDRKEWVFDRLYFDTEQNSWFLIQQDRKSLIKNNLTEIKKAFEQLKEGGFLVKSTGNSGFFRSYLVKRDGVLKTQISLIDQTCLLSNTILHPISIIDSEIDKIKENP